MWAFCRGKQTWWFSLGHMNNLNSFPPQKANREQANPKPYLSHGILTLTSHKLHTPQKNRFFSQQEAMRPGVHWGNSGGKTNDYFSILWKTVDYKEHESVSVVKCHVYLPAKIMTSSIWCGWISGIWKGISCISTLLPQYHGVITLALVKLFVFLCHQKLLENSPGNINF